MGKQLVISVMSKDRHGIIADITAVIYDLGGDLADLNQSVLGGYFTMLLIAEFDESTRLEDLSSAFSLVQSETKIEVIIREMDITLEVERNRTQRDIYLVTAQAVNRTGLVKTMGNLFYSNNINVMDLVTTREKNKYTMIFQVDLKNVPSLEGFRHDLNKLADQEGMTVVLQHHDIFTVTNEITTPAYI